MGHYLLPEADYAAACRAVNRAAAGEALADAAKSVLDSIGDAIAVGWQHHEHLPDDLILALENMRSQLAAWEAAGKEGV